MAGAAPGHGEQDSVMPRATGPLAAQGHSAQRTRAQPGAAAGLWLTAGCTSEDTRSANRKAQTGQKGLLEIPL